MECRTSRTRTESARAPIVGWVLAALALLLVAAPRPVLADSGRDSTTPTGWFFYSNITADAVDDVIAGGYRPVTVKIHTVSPLRFTATFVRNSGGYFEAGSWWYFGLTEAQVNGFLSANSARPISIDPYLDGNGNVRFVVVMVRNTGPSAKTWWWWYGQTTAQLGAFADANNARPVDLDSDVWGGTRVYHAIFVRRTGSDNIGWGWHFGANENTIRNWLNISGQRIIDLQVVDPNAPTFNVVYEQSAGQGWWWFFGVTNDDIGELPGQYASRVFDYQRYQTGGGERYAVVMLSNANALTNRMLGIFTSRTNGDWGAYLKRVGGPVLADLAGDQVFEPASTIKVLHHVHAMRQVQAGSINLNSSVLVYSGYTGSCPQDTGPFFEQLQTTLTEMMVNSDNARTQAIRARFGEAAINATAQFIGMPDTLIQHRIGCAGGADAAIAEPNRLTLHDLGELYEDVAQGLLTGTNRDTFYNIMINSLPSGLSQIIDQEAAALGVAPHRETAFRNGIFLARKAGNYAFSISGNSIFHQTRGGWIELPRRAGCRTTMAGYVHGSWVNDASNDANASAAANEAFVEVLRDEVRAALATYCIADFDSVSGVQVADIFAFLRVWFAGDACADVDGFGGVQVADIFAFLRAWFAGC